MRSREEYLGVDGEWVRIREVLGPHAPLTSRKSDWVLSPSASGAGRLAQP